MLLLRLAFAGVAWAVPVAGWLVPVGGWAFLKAVESVAWLVSVAAGAADFKATWLSFWDSACSVAEEPTETWFSALFSTCSVAVSSSAWATWAAPMTAGANKNPIARDTVATDNLRIEYFIFLSWKNIPVLLLFHNYYFIINSWYYRFFWPWIFKNLFVDIFS